MSVHICDIHKVYMKPEPLFIDEKDKGEYYCPECFKQEIAIETLIKNNLIAVQKSKIDAVINHVHKENSEGSFRYDVYSNLIDMLEDLKK